MTDFEQNPRKYLQLGAIDRELALTFRQQAAKRKFKQIDILRQIVGWWIGLDVKKQRALYFGDNIAVGPSIEECIENIKLFVKIKLPSPEEQRMISALRKALGPEPRQKRKRG